MNSVEQELNYIYSIIRPVHNELPTIILKTSDLKKSQEVLENIGVSLVSHNEVATSNNVCKDS